MGLRALRSRRLQYFSTAVRAIGGGRLQKSDGCLDRCRTQVHVPLRRPEVLDGRPAPGSVLVGLQPVAQAMDEVPPGNEPAAR